jgi:DNA-binding NtrC family response regulator
MARILVVDDEIGICELLAETLADGGHEVHTAQSGAEASAALAAIDPDLVLLDVWMPDANGLELLREWKARGSLSVPVVILSAYGTIDLAVEATRIGALAFLEKPISLQKLLDSVQTALAAGAPRRRVETRSHSFPAPARNDVQLAPPLHMPLREARGTFERAYFEALIREERGQIARVAERSGLERTHLYRRLKQLGISLPGAGREKHAAAKS